MEYTDGLNKGLNPADARFLMLTAITHHRFSSPIWGRQQLPPELAYIDRLASQAVVDHG